MSALMSCSGALHALRDQCPHGVRVKDRGLALRQSQILHDTQQLLVLVWLPWTSDHGALILEMVTVAITATVCHAAELGSDGCPLTLVFCVKLNQLLVVLFAPGTDVVLGMEHAANMQVNVQQRASLQTNS